MFTMMTYLITPSLLIFSGLVTADTSSSKWKRNVSLDNKRSPSGQILTSRSLINCANACESDKTCQSFSYVKHDLDNCVIHTTLLDPISADLYDVPGSAYYTMDICPTTNTGVTYPTFTCPADDTVFRTVTLNDTCNTTMTYRVFKTSMNQADAAASCASVGGFLARVTTIAKMNMLLALTRCPGYSSGDYYVDGSNAQSGSYITSNNEPIPMSNDFWADGKPNDPASEHCFRMSAAFAHKWNDCQCSATHFYICEQS